MTIKMITPPKPISATSDFDIFLAGSIEMGTARKWQDIVFNSFLKEMKNNELAELDFTFYNPYRDDWDNTIGNSIKDKRFNEQVSWEWKALHFSDLVIFNFEPETKSPISLLELGAMAAIGKRCLVCCPKKFWKFGNVEFICDYYKIPLVKTLKDLNLSLITNALYSRK